VALLTEYHRECIEVLQNVGKSTKLENTFGKCWENVNESCVVSTIVQRSLTSLSSIVRILVLPVSVGHSEYCIESTVTC